MNEQYFSLIRNYQRFSWVTAFFMGASPIVDTSFLQDQKHLHLETVKSNSFYSRLATSLRLSDLGYQNHGQDKAYVCYNTLETYIKSMLKCITLDHPPYVALGVKKDGEYQQLNTHFLQTENEYYSAIRPKRSPNPNQRALHALRLNGVEYVEMRTIDLNPFHPIGIDCEDIYFLETFALFCLLLESPFLKIEAFHSNKHNLQQVAQTGKDLQQNLTIFDTSFSIQRWLELVIENLIPCAEYLDASFNTTHYGAAIKHKASLCQEIQALPSSRLIDAFLSSQAESFLAFSLSQSKQFAKTLKEKPLSAAQQGYFENLTKMSLKQQTCIEAQDKNTSFEAYLTQYLKND